MEITIRDLWTVIHGMGFGALFMLAFSGAVAEFYRMTTPGADLPGSSREQKLFRIYLSGMVIMAWLAVFTGAYLVYPWYRASAPVGADLSLYPKALLVSSPHTSEWHNVGMEWKEHVAWLAPISITMVASVFLRYGAALAQHKDLRRAALVFTLVAFIATGVAGAFGAFLNKYAPVRGGEVVQILQGGKE